MSLQERIKDSLIKQVVQGMVSRANAKFDMHQVMQKYSAEGRTLNFIITDLDDGYGFAIVDSRMVLTNVLNPTCLVSMEKRTFSAIVTGKISQTQAFLMDEIKVVGTNWLRDSIVINKIFDELKNVMLKRG